MNQDSALALSKCESKETFIEMFEAGEQAFPIISSVQIMRSTGKTEGDSQRDGQINFTIVAATEQTLEEKPTQATIRLLKLCQKHQWIHRVSCHRLSMPFKNQIAMPFKYTFQEWGYEAKTFSLARHFYR